MPRVLLQIIGNLWGYTDTRQRYTPKHTENGSTLSKHNANRSEFDRVAYRNPHTRHPDGEHGRENDEINKPTKTFVRKEEKRGRKGTERKGEEEREGGNQDIVN